jgi:hypothetical protein
MLIQPLSVKKLEISLFCSQWKWKKGVHEIFYAQAYFCTSIWICSVYSIDRTLMYMLRRKSCNIVADVDIYVNNFAY